MEFNTLDSQREACELYINARAHDGWQLIPDHYDDGGFTGANIERPAFQRLLADIEAGRVDVVVVYKVDRLSRSLLDFAQVMDRFNKAGVAFVSVTQNFSTADAMGRLTLNMLMSFAEFEREMIAERTRDKIAAARRRGKWTGGRLPLGYDTVDKKLVVNEVEAIVVREIFDLYLELRSALAVTKTLNDRGRRMKRSTAKNAGDQKKRPWTKDAVLRVIKNPLFAGLVASSDGLHQGEHEPIVPRETWERAQALLGTGSSPPKGRAPNPAYLLRGLLRCRCCKWVLTPASTRKTGREYRYYRSIAADKKGKDECRVRSLPAEAIEDLVIKQLREATAEGTLAEEVLKNASSLAGDRRKELSKKRASLPKTIAALATEGQSLAAKVQETEGPATRILDDRLREVGTDLASYERQLAEVERQLEALDERVAEAEWVAAALRDFDTIWEVMTVKNRYRLVHALVHEVVVDEKEGKVLIELADLNGVEDHQEVSVSPPSESTLPPGRSEAPSPTAEASP